ncbi:helix-turn-helix domain-containing protein [Nguyenibacter vanlangensis]|uniref:Helix-turn-helix domain-containing protein n=1 Tax=Nguyenibacter vanlangensis TaxID=1216886 RepID=A0ABZ3D0W6_9PROT
MSMRDDESIGRHDVSTSYNQIFTSPKEIQRRFGMGHSTFYRLLNQGAFEAVKFGSATRVRIASVEDYFASLPRISTPVA